MSPGGCCYMRLPKVTNSVRVISVKYLLLVRSTFRSCTEECLVVKFLCNVCRGFNSFTSTNHDSFWTSTLRSQLLLWDLPYLAITLHSATSDSTSNQFNVNPESETEKPFCAVFEGDTIDQRYNLKLKRRWQTIWSQFRFDHPITASCKPDHSEGADHHGTDGFPPLGR